MVAIGAISAECVGSVAENWTLVSTAGREIQLGRCEFEDWATQIIPPGKNRPVMFDALDTGEPDLAAYISQRKSASRFISYDRLAELKPMLSDGLDTTHSILRRLRLPQPGIHIVDQNIVTAISPTDLLSGLAGQRHLTGAEAFIVMSSPKASNNTAIDGTRQSLLLASGVIGEVFYLLGVRHGIGVTGVGGIDANFWNTLLSPGQQATYIIAIGNPVESDKFDAIYPGAHR
ncbi:MAG TPA: hypothetical protein VJT72_13230 [Pseudonocardiaceae bacterium]|nr:hypothetical protein [Pseudonocardiaceae bacterium]